MSEFYNLNKSGQYNARVNDTMLKLARFVPFIMLGYGLMVHFQLLPGSRLYSWQALVALTIALTAVGLTQSKDYGQSVLQQLSYYLLILSYAVFVVGIQGIMVLWAPLSVTTVLNFGTRYYWYSSLLLLGFSLLDGLLQYSTRGGWYVLESLLYALLIMVATGIIIAIISALMTDRTTLLKIKRKENLEYNRMQAIINSLSDAIVSVNGRGIIRIYNAASLGLLDTNKPIGGQKFDSVFRLYDEKNKAVDLVRQITSENKTILREDLHHLFEDGESVRLSITGAPIYTSYKESDHSKPGFIIILRDITKAKSLEEERDEFISVISHELRTPITITEASISNMQFFAQKEKASHEIIKGLGEAHDQVVYLAKMINDLASLSRAEREQMPLKESINITDLMQTFYSQYVSQARAAGLPLNLDVGSDVGSITSNRLYIEEILQNLITNAIKYTGKGSITLQASRTANGVLLAVKDTGSGIAKTERQKVFEKFYRSEDYRTRETSGTGLGLYVAEKLAEKLNASIKLESRLHHGSTFSIEITDGAIQKA